MNPELTLLALGALTVLSLTLGWIISSRHERELVLAEEREKQAREKLLERQDRDEGDYLRQRASTVADACHQAVDLAKQAWRAGDRDQRALWVGIHEACGDEFRDLAAHMKAREAA